MAVLRFLRQPLAWLLAVPVVAGLSLVLVGPGASGTRSHAAAPTTTTTTSVVSIVPAASETPVGSSGAGTKPAWAQSYDGTAKSVRAARARSRASMVAPDVESADLAAGTTATTTTIAATTTTIAPSGLGALPPGVVSESSSPILLVVVAACVVGIAVGGYLFWRRRRTPARSGAR
jgi:hypothetical protein